MHLERGFVTRPVSIGCRIKPRVKSSAESIGRYSINIALLQTETDIVTHGVKICDIATHGMTIRVKVTHDINICDIVTRGMTKCDKVTHDMKQRTRFRYLTPALFST